MGDLRRTWRQAKEGFLRCGQPTGDFPADFVMLMASNQGHQLGPALDKFEAAKGFDAKHRVLGPVVAALDGYRGEISEAYAATSASGARQALESLATALEALRHEVEKAGQPPRPAERFVHAGELLRFDFAAGLNTRVFAPRPIIIEVGFEIDAAMLELANSHQESLRLAWLGDVARAELEKLRGAFQDTILAIDEKLSRDATGMEAKVAEANAVLAHYGRIVEDRVNALVQREWQGFLARRAYLRSFRLKCGIKIGLGTIGIGVAAASLVLSYGTAWVSIVAITRTCTEIARTVQRLGQSIEETERKVTRGFDWVKERLKQQESEYPGARDRGWEVAKEVLAGLSSFSKDVLKVSSGIQADCEQYLGQISQMERQADELTRKLLEVVDQLNRIGPGTLPAAQAERNRLAQRDIERLFQQIADMQEQINRKIRLGDDALEAILALRNGESIARYTERGIGFGSQVLAVNGLLDFIAQCATDGDTMRELAMALI